MANLLSYCGLICKTCPIHLATIQENEDERARIKTEIVKKLEGIYNLKYTVEDITDCDGCKSEGGRLFSSCKKCLIRKCAREKKVENCAYCSEYACGKLETFFKKDSPAKTRLNAVRNKIL